MDKQFMNIAIEAAKRGLQTVGEGPFGACLVKDGRVISVGNNTVVRDNDSTAHAEINVIRDACKKLDTFNLSGCEIYSTCEPCPMCLAAIYWARIDKLYFGCSRSDAANIGFDDEFFYHEVQKTYDKRNIKTIGNQMRHECLDIFKIWQDKNDKVMY
ncbi:nucleoside deaminase [Candidatus Dojkabacteria bacterium]|nr:nucleoside deaminase [Candidatus Dojkabacteria bacterium]